MAVALPRTVRLKLERTLAQWRQWRCDPRLTAMPEARGLLGEGHSNHSVLVTADSQYVVRIDGINPASHGLNRQGEWRTLQVASEAGLAPRPCYFNPELGSLVCEYLPPAESRTDGPAEIAELLRAIHSLPTAHSRLDLRERFLRYEKLLLKSAAENPISRFRDGVWECLARRTSASSQRVFCHNDLLQANRLCSSGRLWAIDWEYSAMGDPWYDLAVVICGDNLSEEDAGSLVKHYLDRSPDKVEQTALLEYSAIYRYLELIWYLSQDHPIMDRDRIEHSTQRLEQALLAARA